MTGVQNANQTKVVVFVSATPGFWAAAVDLDMLAPACCPSIRPIQSPEDLDLAA